MMEWIYELGETPTLDAILEFSIPVLQVINELKELLNIPPDSVKFDNLKELGMVGKIF